MDSKPESLEEIDSLHPMEKKIVVALAENAERSDQELEQETGLDEGQLRRALGWLKTKNYVRVSSERTEQYVSLTDKGILYAEQGTPEMSIVSALLQGQELHMKQIQQMLDYDPEDLSKAVGNLKKNEVIAIERGVLKLVDEQAVSKFAEADHLLKKVKGQSRVLIEDLNPHQKELALAGFRKRGKSKGIYWIDDHVHRTYQLTEQGLQAQDLLQSLQIPLEEISQLTAVHLKERSWIGKAFRKYNITLPAPRIMVGRKHPYREFLDQLKLKLTSLGFEEMQGNIVENEFWNMDALFMPQFHSARDIHDIYFVKKPHTARYLEEPYATQVAQCHENGGNTGSTGWEYAFSKEKARQLVLRSQGTVLSARTLAAQPNIPGKYFALARCFRYDQIDATHAPDFYQIEGIVLGKDINFRHLLGLLKLFAEEVARAEEVQYLPAYFPFTEPSVEVHIKHPILGWMEMGGAGLFRPEVTVPLGVEVPVIAWGLGVDRMAMVALGIEDIRDLFSTDLDFIRSRVFTL